MTSFVLRKEEEMEEKIGEGRSLTETPTWAVATVITLLVSVSFLFHRTLKKIVKVHKNSLLPSFLFPLNLSH